MWKAIIVGTAIFNYTGSLLAQEKLDALVDNSTDLPKNYANYLIAPNTLSPDKKFGVIYPKLELCLDEPPRVSEDRCKDYLIALQPFQMLTVLDTKWPHFEHKNHGGVTAAWSSDGSAVLITLDSKWGPGDIFLYEIRDGRLRRSTNLLKKVHALLVPDYKKANIGRYNQYHDFIFNTEDIPLCVFDDLTHILISGTATTDPKTSSGEEAWDASVEAVWDIPKAKFTSQKVTRMFAGVRK